MEEEFKSMVAERLVTDRGYSYDEARLVADLVFTYVIDLEVQGDKHPDKINLDWETLSRLREADPNWDDSGCSESWDSSSC